MTKDLRILLVEDEEHLLDVIRLNLELEGYTVVTATTGPEALERYHSGRYNLMVLDVMLPGMDGYAVCETIRLQDKQLPILFLTAKNASEDRIKGLKIGGDDYLSKPFNLEELLLRVENLVRRNAEATPVKSVDQVRIGNSIVNFTTYEVQDVAGETRQLSKRESLLLKLLIERSNEVVSREEILEKVWGYDVYPSTRTIDNYILAFRKYFEPQPKDPKHFHAVRGVGYKYTA